MPSEGDTEGQAAIDELDKATTGSVTRRTLIRHGAIATGVVVWATPVVQSFAAPALAQTGSPPPPSVTGSINGRVTDSSTGGPIAGAVVMADTGHSDTTRADGFYELPNVPSGDRTVTASAAGYVPASSTVFVPDGESATENFSLSPLGVVSAVLTWNAQAEDLDLHMSGPDANGGRFHVFFGNTTHEDYVSLDRDDRDGEGPETIHVTVSAGEGQWVAGEYHVWVHRYSEDSFNSDAVVRLNDQVTQRGEFEVPEPPGRPFWAIWLVVHFDIDSSGAMSNIQAQQAFTEGDYEDEF